MVITYRTIKKVAFPVFILPSGDWYEKDGLLYTENRLIDDRNMPGDTLGKRRIQTPMRDILPLRKSLNSHIGIIKQTTRYFIDSKGRPFIYEKSRSCSLKYFKIKEVELKGTASILKVKGVSFPFVVPRPPTSGMTWAGILHLGSMPWLLYEYSGEKLRDTRRKV